MAHTASGMAIAQLHQGGSIKGQVSAWAPICTQECPLISSSLQEMPVLAPSSSGAQALPCLYFNADIWTGDHEVPAVHHVRGLVNSITSSLLKPAEPSS